MVVPTLATVAPDPVPPPTTPERTLLSLVSTGRSGRTLRCCPDPSRRTSLLLEMSSSKSCSICCAKSVSSATRSISQLAARLLKFRFVEPTFDHHRLGVDHRAAVLEDPDPCLEELPVAGARGPAYPRYVVGRRREDPHVHAVPSGSHQGLGKDWHGEEVGVGDPEALLHPGREQLKHTQGAHPARLLDDYAHGLLPRHLDVIRVGALIVGQPLSRLIPHAGESPVYVGHGRPSDADRGVPVGQPCLWGGHHPAVGDADTARRGVLTVNGDQLSMVASDRPERRSRRWRVDRPDLYAGIPEASPE